jgi:hypothetical protein
MVRYGGRLEKQRGKYENKEKAAKKGERRCRDYSA